MPEPVDEFIDEQQPKAKSIFKSMYFWMAVFLLLIGGMITYLVFAGLEAKEENPISVTQDYQAPTASPTADPLLALLPRHTQFTIAEDTDLKGPQALAHFWLRDDPQFWSYSDDRLKQRFALATLYFASDGDNWTHQGGKGMETVLLPGNQPPVEINKEGWLDYQAHECDWFSMYTNGTICNSQQEIVILDLQMNELAGTVPEELELLASVQTIRLHDNQLTGTVPDAVCQIPNVDLQFDCSRTLCGCTSCDCDI